MGRQPIKTMFRGYNELTLDSKGRLAIPTKYHERLRERCGGNVVVTADPDQCLLLYPFPDWEEVERKLMKLPSFDPSVRDLQRLIVGYATELEMDGNGRILLPPGLRDKGHLTRDVVMLGQGLKFELWDQTLFKERPPVPQHPNDSSAELKTFSL